MLPERVIERAIVVTSIVHVPITMRQSFHILTTTYQKAFILGPKVTIELAFIP